MPTVLLSFRTSHISFSNWVPFIASATRNWSSKGRTTFLSGTLLANNRFHQFPYSTQFSNFFACRRIPFRGAIVATLWRWKSVASRYVPTIPFACWPSLPAIRPPKSFATCDSNGGTASWPSSKPPCKTTSRTKIMRRVRRNTMAERLQNYINVHQLTSSTSNYHISKCAAFKIRNSLGVQHFFLIFFLGCGSFQKWNPGKDNEPNEHSLWRSCSWWLRRYAHAVAWRTNDWSEPTQKSDRCLCTFVLSSIQHVVFQAWAKTDWIWGFQGLMCCHVYLNILPLITLMISVRIPWTVITLDSVLYTAFMFRFWQVSCFGCQPNFKNSFTQGKRLNESMPLPYHTGKLGLLTYPK